MIQFLCILLFAVTSFAGETVKEPELSPAQEKWLHQKLHETRLAKIAIDQFTVREAIEFLVAKIHGTEADFGLNLRLTLQDEGGEPVPKAPAQKPNPDGIPGLETPGGQIPEREPSGPKITFQATNVPVDKILDEICRQAKLQWKLTFRGVLITPFPQKNRTHR